jgi:hypothetical protein
MLTRITTLGGGKEEAQVGGSSLNADMLVETSRRCSRGMSASREGFWGGGRSVRHQLSQQHSALSCGGTSQVEAAAM